ncbi:MAG: DUF4177 domain-containing protein [Phycisphaerales bacterium]
MQKWEYATVMVEATGVFVGGKVDVQALRETLNNAGREGWEVCGVFETNMQEGRTRSVVVLLKRPLDA